MCQCANIWYVAHFTTAIILCNYYNEKIKNKLLFFIKKIILYMKKHNLSFIFSWINNSEK